MPTRKRPRDEDRRARIDRERRACAEINASRQRAHAQLLADIQTTDPPPF
jgi:hypothetical protein